MPSGSREYGASKMRFLVTTAKLLAESITGEPCPICLCRVEERRAAVLNPCRHVYCLECIRKWSNLKRNCPLCNSQFDSWYFQINPSTETFQHEKLLAAPAAPAKGTAIFSSDVNVRRRWGRWRYARYIQQLRASNLRTRPLPWRRSFSRGHDEHPPDAIAERVLRWRASVYEQKLQAVPFSSKNCLLQQIPTSNDAKKLLLQRIEPWIKRELHAVLGDPEPSVIVHVATSLFISMHEREYKGPSGVEHDFLSALRPFLDERTEMFWHELRCFAECSYSMETYDSVVEYNRLLE